MSEVLLARWQFGITSTYHFLFVPLTLGLSVLLAWMEWQWVRTGRSEYKRMTQFWGKLFLVNFSVGVVTGIVQEFHFGMNWAEYSRFMGDIFGAPLAMEALSAFFVESTFLGLWIFGWDRLSPKVHAICITLVAFASNLSAFWILVANSFMQHPVGFALQNGRAEMVDFGALLMNPYVWKQFPHTVLAGLTTGGAFLAAVSAWYLLRNRHLEIFRPSFKLGTAVLLAGSLAVMGTGHVQTQYMGQVQPMKLASVEALWESADPAPFAIAVIPDEKNQRNTMEIGVPGMLTLLAYDSFQGEVKGIKDLQREAEQKYGPGNYIPQVTPLFFAFRFMAGAGVAMMALGALGLWLSRKEALESSRLYLKLTMLGMLLPYVANSCGWFVAEAGRQPWLVVGLQKVADGVSTNVTSTEIWLSLFGFTVIYGLLAAAALYLVFKFIKKGPDGEGRTEEATVWN